MSMMAHMVLEDFVQIHAVADFVFQKEKHHIKNLLILVIVNLHMEHGNVQYVIRFLKQKHCYMIIGIMNIICILSAGSGIKA